MKKVLKYVGFASLAVLAGTGMAMAGPNDGLCKLVVQLGGLFRTLRLLAFAGAAFVIAGWAWGYISSGKVELKDVKEKGVGMLVGFVLLFSLGLVLSAVLSMADPNNGSLGCVESAFM